MKTLLITLLIHSYADNLVTIDTNIWTLQQLSHFNNEINYK